MHDKMDSLAARIRKETTESGFCEIRGEDLSFIWPEGEPISNEEKCMHVKNFALRYHFAVAINFNSLSAVFLVAK